MGWFVFSVLTAFCESLKDVFSKKGLNRIDEYVVAWSLNFFAAIFLLPILIFIEIPALPNKYWIALLVSGGLNSITTVLYMKAIKYSDISITVPMVAFTPLFLLMTSPLLVGEFPNLFGLIGVLLIVTGSYVLHFDQKKKSYFAPFRVLLKEKGPQLMLIVAFIWSITSNFDKIGIQNSSPLFWSISSTLFVSFILFPIMVYKSKARIRQIPFDLKTLIPIGISFSLTTVFQMMAISMTLVAYVISIKRTNTIISVLFGYFIFNEKGVRERLIGASIMILGVLLIGLS